MVTKGVGAGSLDSYVLFEQNGTFKAAVGRHDYFGVIDSGIAVVPGTWYHVAMTFDDTTKILNLYVNGTLAASNPFGISIEYDNSPFVIGTGQSSGAPSYFFPGQADEVEIFNRALTGTEVQNIYNASFAGTCKVNSGAGGMAGWWPGDGDARDISGNGNNGTPQGGAGFVAGEVGQAFNLNGTDAYISVPNNPVFDPTTAGSQEAWVKLAALPSTAAHVMEIIGEGGLNRDFDLQVETDNRFHFYVGPSGQNVASTTVVQTGVWYHVAGTWDSSSGGLKMYVNGVLENTNGVLQTRVASGQPLFIGNQPIFNSRFFNGVIDEPTVFNRSLTSNEVQSIFNAGVAGKYKSVATPTGSNVSSNAGSDATVTFLTVTTDGTTQQVPLDLSKLPPLLFTSTGLTYDVSTSASYSGQPTVCFNLPSFTSIQFANLRIRHLEAGSWVDRTLLSSVYPDLCTSGLTSLSPFAITTNAPTAANVSVAGRVLTANGRGIYNARVTVTGNSLPQRISTITGPFGYYQIDNLEAGETYVVTVQSKRFTFPVPSRVINLTDNLTGFDFIGNP
jgi:hypothetical protein